MPSRLIALFSFVLFAAWSASEAAAPPRPKGGGAKAPFYSYAIMVTAGARKDPSLDVEILHSRYHGPTKLDDVGKVQMKAVNRDRQARGVFMRLSRSMLLNGSAHEVDGRVRPPGWQDDAGYTRLMLWPYELGGDGFYAQNLVTVSRKTAARYAAVMQRVRKEVMTEGKTVELTVTPVYRDKGKPASLAIKANVPLDGDKTEITLVNVAPGKGEKAAEIDRLKKLMPPPRLPAAPGTAAQWEAVERRLKLKFPKDYKQYVTVYGSGEINGFIRVANPFRAGKYDDFEEWLQSWQKTWPGLKKEFPDSHPYDVWPAANGLLPLGSTINGDTIWWKTKGKPDEWTIVVWSRGGEGYVEYDCGWLAFLRRLFEEDIQVGFWPRADVRPKFKANEAK